MKKSLLSQTSAIAMALVSTMVPALLTAQVSTYQFSESVGTYTPITDADGGVVLGQPATPGQTPNNPKAYLDPLFPGGIGQSSLAYFTDYSGTLRSGFPIGFNFSYNGDVFDRIAISEVGWISFGKSADGNQAVWCYASRDGGPAHGDPFVQSAFTPPGPVPDYKRNRVAGFGNSGLRMQNWSNMAPPGPVASLRMATIGTAPNRVCVVQWKDFGLSNDYGVSYNTINFQIRLNEVDNSVDVSFGPMSWDHLLGRRQDTQIGLSGRTNQDFNGRVVVYEQPAFLYDWSNTAPALPADTALANMVYCHMAMPEPGQPNGSGVPPVVGLNWHWAAPVCPPPAWPLAIGDISFDSATATWDNTNPGEFEYYLTDTNYVGGPEVASGTTTDPQISLFGLQPLTNYFLFVRRICNGEPGVWSMANRFRTIGGQVIVCDGTAVEVDYCSHQHDTIYWLYQSADLSPLKIEFSNGFISSNTADSYKIWNTATIPPTGSPAFNMPTGNPAGLSYQSATGVILIQLITGQGSCATQDWFLPFHWRIGCKNCQDPLASFNVVDDCANQQYSVAVNVASMGSATSILLNNDLNVAPTTVMATGTHLAGPFPSGQGVHITVQNGQNAMCHADSPALIGAPCALVGCGPTTYTYCYDNNETRQWAYQGNGSQNIGIRFIQGSLGYSDQLAVYHSLNPDNDPAPTQVPSGGLANNLYTSGSVVGENTLVMALASNDSYSCVTPDPVMGSTEPWKYVVACYDGCVQPKATFVDSCISDLQFKVKVVLTQLGNTGSVTITNDGGAPAVTATALGAYYVGPFASNAQVTLNVEGASVLCTWTSPVRTMNCSGVGISEVSAGQLGVYPNPTTGRMEVALPKTMQGHVDLQVLDLAGRTVASQSVNGVTTTSMELASLPNGLYTLVARNANTSITTKISIQH